MQFVYPEDPDRMARLRFLIWWSGLPEDHPRKWSPDDSAEVRREAAQCALDEINDILSGITSNVPNA